MLLVKKLSFAFPFLLFTFLFLYLVNPFFKDYNLLFSLELTTFYKLIYVVSSLILAGLMFAVFSALAMDWKIVLPVSLVVSLSSFFIFDSTSALIIFFGLLISFSLSFAIIQDKMKNYLGFHANALFNPAIKNLGFFIIISLSIAFYFTTSQQIRQSGFKIPDSLLNTAVQFGAAQTPQVQGVSVAQIPTLTPEQQELIKQNPDLLKQFGVDPKILETLPQTTTTPQSLPAGRQVSSSSVVKNLLKSQLDKIIEPYLKYLPAVLTLLFIVTLQSLFSLVSIFLPIFVFLIFWALEKTNYIHFEKEMREVKKLVV